MLTPPRHQDPDASSSRFGESRFGQSRFGHDRSGTWIEEGRPDPQGRTTGLYKSGTPGTPVAGLTVVRPTPTQTATSEKPAIPVGAGAPKALNLPGGRKGVLLFHGLTSTPLELQFLARGLHRAGYTVRVAVIEGYSHALPASSASGHVEWARAAIAEFDRMREQCDTLAVGGLCIGALLALHVASQRGGDVSHILALSTTLHYDGWAAPWTRWMLPLARILPFAGRIAVPEREPFGLKDERLRTWIAAQMKESGGSAAGASALRVGDLLEAQNLMRVVKVGLARITAPTLLLHAREDDCASPRSAYEVRDGVKSEKVRCVLLEDSYHMISIDKEKSRVLAEMRDFLQGKEPGADTLDTSSSRLVATPILRSTEHVRV